MKLVPDFKTLRSTSVLDTRFLDINAYRNKAGTQALHKNLCRLSLTMSLAEPTCFHKMLGHFAASGQLLRHYTQNIDCLELKDPLLSPASVGKFRLPTTIQLHGRLDRMVCQLCTWTGTFDPALFRTSEPSKCLRCESHNQSRKAGVNGVTLLEDCVPMCSCTESPTQMKLTLGVSRQRTCVEPQMLSLSLAQLCKSQGLGNLSSLLSCC